MDERTQSLGGPLDSGEARATAPPNPGPGVKLKDRYLIESELGRGGIGVVYLARDEELLSKRVVIKVLLEEMVEDAWLKKKFQQEKEALARIDHPGVVGVLDAGLTAGGQQFLVMQFVEGQSLEALIKPAGMNFDQVARILRQMGSALSAAHDEGIIHCDLKPANVMVQHPGEARERVRVIDFGIAKVRDSQTARANEMTKVAGTPHYMAPEQIEGEPAAASDIFALGVIAYEMITGRKPFNPRPGAPYKLWADMLDLQRAGVKINPSDLRPELSEAAQESILKALAFAAQDRYPRAQNFTEALADALTGPATGAVSKPLPAPVQESLLEIAHVLFMDIVGYSRLSMDQQKNAIGKLQQIVRATTSFQRAQAQRRLISLPTGDGLALVFFSDLIAAVDCACEIARTLKIQSPFGLRMGVHTGPVYRVADINTNMNVAGGGINIAQRVMDCGDDGHILLSKATADMLGQLDAWAETIRDLGECEVKHGVRVHLYNLYNDEVGSKELPLKLKKKGMNLTLQKLAQRNSCTVSLSISLLMAVLIGSVVYTKMFSSSRLSAMPPSYPSGSPGPANQSPQAALELNVLLEAQKFGPRETPLGNPIALFDKINGKGEIDFKFQKGDGLHLKIISPQAGHLYVLNEASDILVLFPSKTFNGGLDELAANEELRIPYDINQSRSEWLISNQAAPEKFWIVWSAARLPELASLQQLARAHEAPFDITGLQQMDEARDFLAQHLKDSLKGNPDAEKKRINLKIASDVLVVRLYKQ
jgi:serine/threonine protein kinase